MAFSVKVLVYRARKSEQSKIRGLNITGRQQNNILRLNIAVNYSLIMRMLKRAQNLRCEKHSVIPSDNMLLLDIFFKCDAVNYIP